MFADHVVESDHEISLKSMQKDDLLYWEASMYWMRNMLRGRDLKSGHELLKYPVGNPQYNGLMTVSRDHDFAQERALRLLSDEGTKVHFVEPAHAAAYSDYFTKGTSYREGLLPPGAAAGQ